jgi:hypothetical protein
LRLDQIKRVHVSRFVNSRHKEADSEGNPRVFNRTINLDVIGLRCVMKKAMEDGLIQRLPMEGLRPLDEKDVKRPLLTCDDLEKLSTAAGQTKTAKDGTQAPEAELEDLPLLHRLMPAHPTEKEFVAHAYCVS